MDVFECMLCLERIEINEHINRECCSYDFHKNCLSKLLDIKKSCPHHILNSNEFCHIISSDNKNVPTFDSDELQRIFNND